MTDLTDADIDQSLALEGFDARDRYPEYGHDALRVAYRAGWEDRDHMPAVTAHTTVDTVEDLNALPVGSVVRESNGHVWVKHPKTWHCDCLGDLVWTAREVLEESSEDGNTLAVLFRPDGGES